ncbi:MAG: TspO/MBR family protein [Croceibacterium sp.]
MNRLASPAQLRASYVRWALALAPLIVLLGLASGVLGGSTAQSPWFEALRKPAIFPPPALFGIVWTVLYAMMGFALAVVCNAGGARWRGPAVLAFVIQLAVNLAWSPVFFGQHQITLALGIILVMDALVILTTVFFWKVRRVAAWLLLPYLAWILFATVLNWAFLDLNRDLDGVRMSSAVERFEL